MTADKTWVLPSSVATVTISFTASDKKRRWKDGWLFVIDGVSPRDVSDE
jgi:hypothetical protein